MQDKNFHFSILKSTGIFGVSHLVKIVAKVIVNKVAALYLGAIGIGIIGLVENLLSVLNGFVNFGIPASSVREIALATNESDTDFSDENRKIKIILYWSIFSGILGGIVFAVTSYFFFTDFYPEGASFIWFFLLVIYFLFFSLFSAKMAILQGKRELKKMVVIQVWSAIIQMISALFCYSFFGIDGIALAILFSATFSYIIIYFYTINVDISPISISLKQVFFEGLPMVKLGLILSMGALINQIAYYVIRLFLMDFLSLEALGIFQVSQTILIGYLSLIFVVMSNDFYPQLCNFENDKSTFEKYINQQTQFALFLVVPLVLGMYLFAPQIITLLYSAEFVDVLLVLKIALFGLILKTIAWPIGFISLVKGNQKLFFKQNLVSDLINVLTSVMLTYYFGLIGLGIAFSAMFLVSLGYNFFTVYKNYQFQFSSETIQVIIFSIFLGLTALISLIWFEMSYENPIVLGAFFISILFSFFKFKNNLKKTD
jgi:O-antigen/teichoic acid export membrane protein